MKLKRIQKEQQLWANHNFPDRKPWQPLIGTQEELGELSHGFLKCHQHIRGNPEELTAEMKDAIGDMLIFMMDFCNQMNWCMEEILDETWAHVKKRDWKRFPHNGIDK